MKMLKEFWRALRYDSRSTDDVPRARYFWVSGVTILLIFMLTYAWGLFMGSTYRGREPDVSYTLFIMFSHCTLIFASLIWMTASLAVARGDQLKRRDERIRQLEEKLEKLDPSNKKAT